MKYRSKSIAARLNVALLSRKFLKSIIIDVLLALAVMAAWCYIAERSNISVGSEVYSRRFDLVYDIYSAYIGEDDLVYDEFGNVIGNAEFYSDDRSDWGVYIFAEGTYEVFGSAEDLVACTGIVPAPPYAEEVTESSYDSDDSDYSDYSDYSEESYLESETEFIDEIEDEADVVDIYSSEYDFGDAISIMITSDGRLSADASLREQAGWYIDRIVDVFPFSGLHYCFEVISLTGRHESFEIDASVVLTLILVSFGVVVILQLLEFLIGIISGSGVIRRYLRPIDDIAIMAEKLSAVENTVSHGEVSEEIGREYSSGNEKHDDTDISSEELSSLAYAIDSIDDSCARIDIHDTELAGLEAAVNNMLRRLEEAKRKQIRFVDDASHELRTPISVIQGYAGMLDRWGKNDPEIMEEAITAIKNEADHMKVLIDQLLFLARGEMDRHIIEKAEVNVCGILEEIYDESVLLESDLGVSERHEFDASDIYVIGEDGERELREVKITCDEAMIKQAIRILRDNAVKYTPSGGRISLKVYERAASGKTDGGERVCIEVSDTGIGIDKSELPRIFDRFYRGENARADNASGSGLGLSIARWIIEEHGGVIEAISGSGFGTKMTIVL